MITQNDIKNIIKQLNELDLTNWLWIFKTFRENIKKIFNSKYVVLTNNWTAWLYLAYKSIWLKEDDEVITWTYTYHATNSTLLNFTKNIKFCDIDENLTISIKEINKVISDNTKLLIIPHTWWLSPNMNEITKLKEKYKNLIIIEDCSQAHFWKYNEKYLWTFWDIWVFSMQWWKLLTAWEWWFIITNNKDFYEKMIINSDSWKTIENLLEKDSKYLEFSETWLWLKFRPNPLWIALANSQLETIEEKIKTRRYFAEIIKKELKNYEIFYPEIEKHYNSFYWLIWVYNSKNPNFINLIQKIESALIKEIYNPKNNKPNHLLKIFEFLEKKEFSNTEKVYNNLLYFKLYDDIKYEKEIISYINKFKKILW